MPHVIVLQHVAPEGPGAIADSLADRGIETRPVRIDQGQAVPRALDGAAGLVVMGGPMGVYEADRYLHLRDELRLIEAALHAQVPIIGVCLGSQLLAAALGARVYPAPQKEIGWYDVYLQEAAHTDRLWQGVAQTFTPLHWHGDVFDLPAGAVALASSALTDHQAFRYGDSAYGLLFHLEMGRRQIAAMVKTFRDEVVGAGVAPETILADTAACHPRAKELGAVVFERWAAAVLDSVAPAEQ
ncbi:MAG: gamma-glutamyl-gamma-aminobutyrate hydrolase family protein [Chloroflexota bacterium]|nr:gamma-glutamyl-gamma-aminobutyrate hydrolase family protein [Chloroflexota bacterium]